VRSLCSFQAFLYVALQILTAAAQGAAGADLKPETVEGFAHYVQATEARIEKQLASADRLLYVDSLSPGSRDQVMTLLRKGQVFMQRLETRDSSGRLLITPGGLIHHWIGAVFIPGISLGQVLEMVQDYNHHQEIYKPDVVRSRLVSRNGNDFKVEMRFRKKKVVTVTLNTEHDVHYAEIDPAHWYSRSVSTRVAEVENAEKPDEREKPLGHDSGFLWRINSYWRFVQREGGVYVECESVSLTRDIPAGLGWLIRGFVSSVSKESLDHTMKSTRSGALARLATTNH
jgi:hypothetical protein